MKSVKIVLGSYHNSSDTARIIKTKFVGMADAESAGKEFARWLYANVASEFVHAVFKEYDKLLHPHG